METAKDKARNHERIAGFVAIDTPSGGGDFAAVFSPDLHCGPS
jgi:hypothetical protein